MIIIKLFFHYVNFSYEIFNRIFIFLIKIEEQLICLIKGNRDNQSKFDQTTAMYNSVDFFVKRNIPLDYTFQSQEEAALFSRLIYRFITQLLDVLFEEYPSDTECKYQEVLDQIRCEVIVKDIYELKPGDPKTVLRIQATKTSKGKRQVPLLPEVADKVLSHMCWQKEQAEKSYGLYEENPYLVSNELGHFLDPGTVRKKLKAAAESIGITDFHPHCLRHTYASQAVKCGVPLPYLSDILGHKSTSFTAKVYVSLDLEGRANAQAAMSELIRKSIK